MKTTFKLIILSLLFFSGCFSQQNSKFKFKEQQETDMISIISIIKKSNFIGDFDFKNKLVRNKSAEVITQTIPDSIIYICNKYEFSRIVSDSEFVYFIIGGFKGTNFGLLYTNITKEKIKGFYDIDFIKKSYNDRYNWFFVNSKLY